MKMDEEQHIDLAILHCQEQSESWLRDNRDSVEASFVDGDDDVTTEVLENSVVCCMAEIADFNARVLHLPEKELKEWVKTATWKDVAMLLYNTLYEDVTDAIERDQTDEDLDDIDLGILRSMVLASLVENKNACVSKTDDIGE